MAKIIFTNSHIPSYIDPAIVKEELPEYMTDIEMGEYIVQFKNPMYKTSFTSTQNIEVVQKPTGIYVLQDGSLYQYKVSRKG